MKKVRAIWIVLASLTVFLMAAGGITYGWIAHNAATATLLKIQPPDTIGIIPIEEEGLVELVELDLDFKTGDKQENGKITISRPIRIQSSNSVHSIEIVHTTNLTGMEFEIYPAKLNDDKTALEKDGAPLLGEYKNKVADQHLAEQQVLKNYESTGHVADNHAYPLYWLANSCYRNGYDVSEENKSTWRQVESYLDYDTDQYFTYYYLEITWIEETKETDLFYIIAHNVA